MRIYISFPAYDSDQKKKDLGTVIDFWIIKKNDFVENWCINIEEWRLTHFVCYKKCLESDKKQKHTSW